MRLEKRLDLTLRIFGCVSVNSYTFLFVCLDCNRIWRTSLLVLWWTLSSCFGLRMMPTRMSPSSAGPYPWGWLHYYMSPLPTSLCLSLTQVKWSQRDPRSQSSDNNDGLETHRLSYTYSTYILSCCVVPIKIIFKKNSVETLVSRFSFYACVCMLVHVHEYYFDNCNCVCM